MTNTTSIDGIYQCLIITKDNPKGMFKMCRILHEYKGNYACVVIEDDALYWTNVVEDFEHKTPKIGEVWRAYDGDICGDIVVDSIVDGTCFGSNLFTGKSDYWYLDDKNAHKLFDSVDDMRNRDLIGSP